MQELPTVPSDAIKIARSLLAESGTAALASVGAAGAPFASYVTMAPGPDRQPLLLLSRLAVHTRNLKADPRASLLLVREADAGTGRLTAARLSLVGAVQGALDQPEARSRFLARHPDAALYAGFDDFAFYRFSVVSGHLVAGFGRIADIPAVDLLASL